ncbi:hypothetical protein [Vibrio phage vB_VibM_83AMN]|nr:hypothetical protein [Vibrio phage vB_VibM_83AMN]
MQTIISDNKVKLKQNQGVYFVLVNGLNVKETHKLKDALEAFNSYAPEKTYKAVNIESIKAGDTIQHNGELRTVCSSDIKYNAFTGTTIFGDSYKLGYLEVIKVIFN